MAKKLIRFDWAMKKMLCHKSNFDILEGFLSELLEEERLVAILGLHENGVPVSIIAKSLKISEEQVQQVISNPKDK